MMKASRFLTQQDKEAVSAAIDEAEKITSGEIVPVVATASGRYDRAEDLVGVVIALLAFAISWILFQDVSDGGADWSGGPSLVVGLVPSLLIIVGGYIIGTALASRLAVLRLPFIPRSEMAAEVEKRAHEVFARERIRGTSGGTGVLIYVSLYERIVRVLPDDAIAEKIDQSEWKAIRDTVINAIKARNPGEGLASAVQQCGELLAPHFPVQPGDVNELSNEIRILD